jgi:hypothetical protein
MSGDNATPIRTDDREPPEPDPFDGIYDRMQEQLDALRCVLSVIEVHRD